MPAVLIKEGEEVFVNFANLERSLPHSRLETGAL
jgi:hypothetical protein